MTAGDVCAKHVAPWVPLYTSLRAAIGSRPTITLGLVYFLLKGVFMQVFILVQLPLYKDVLGLGAEDYQKLTTAAMMAWSMKPALGLLSDNVPIFGYRKKYYNIVSCFMLLCGFALAFSLAQYATSSGLGQGDRWAIALTLTAVFFGCSLASACIDLLCEGRYSELMRKAPRASSSIVSWVWGWAMFGSAVGAALIGPLSDHGAPNIALLVCIPCAVFLLYPLGKNWLREKRVASGHISPPMSPDAFSGSASSPPAQATQPPKSPRRSAAQVEGEELDAAPVPQGDAAVRETVSVERRGLLNGDVGSDDDLPAAAGDDDDEYLVDTYLDDADLHLQPGHEDYEDDAEFAREEDRRRVSVARHRASQDSVLHDGATDDDAADHREADAVWADESTAFGAVVPQCLIDAFGRRRDPRRAITVYGVIMAFCSLSLALASAVVKSPAALGTYLFAMAVPLLYLSFAALPSTIAKANLFMFLKEALYVAIPGALDFFFTADHTCVPNGPAFSYTYYQTFTSIVGNAAGAIGVWLFQTWLAKKPLRYAFWMTTIVKVLASLFDIALVSRWNIDLGIPDHVAYMLGDAIVASACFMLDWMPAVVLISRLCPPRLEATVFALLAGCSNLGQSVSRTIGTVLIPVFGIKTDPGACDFTHLPSLILVAHCVLPLLLIPLAAVLVPGGALGRGDEDPEHVEDQTITSTVMEDMNGNYK